MPATSAGSAAAAAAAPAAILVVEVVVVSADSGSRRSRDDTNDDDYYYYYYYYQSYMSLSSHLKLKQAHFCCLSRGSAMQRATRRGVAGSWGGLRGLRPVPGSKRAKKEEEYLEVDEAEEEDEQEEDEEEEEDNREDAEVCEDEDEQEEEEAEEEDNTKKAKPAGSAQSQAGSAWSKSKGARARCQMCSKQQGDISGNGSSVYYSNLSLSPSLSLYLPLHLSLLCLLLLSLYKDILYTWLSLDHRRCHGAHQSSRASSALRSTRPTPVSLGPSVANRSAASPEAARTPRKSIPHASVSMLPARHHWT